jgi:hypothetical protein
LPWCWPLGFGFGDGGNSKNDRVNCDLASMVEDRPKAIATTALGSIPRLIAQTR